MLSFLIMKLPSMALLAFVSSVIAFILPRMAPGDTAVTIAGPDASPGELAAITRELGLDRPLLVQYWDWLQGAFAGDFGLSLTMRRSVASLISTRLESTLELAFLAIVLTAIFGFALGALADTRRSWWGKGGMDFVNSVLLATPPFLTGLILILILGIVFPVLPVSGEVALSKDSVLGLQHLVLPALALALPQAAVVARLLQTSMKNVRGEDFIDLAKAKGVPEGRIFRRHILRNSLGTAVVALGLRAGELLAGTIVIEAIFARNGLGQLAVNSVQARDYPVLQALILGAVLIAMIMQLLSDVALAALDPRIRLEG